MGDTRQRNLYGRPQQMGGVGGMPPSPGQPNPGLARPQAPNPGPAAPTMSDPQRQATWMAEMLYGYGGGPASAPMSFFQKPEGGLDTQRVSALNQFQNIW